MSKRLALTGGTVYLGGGNVIEDGYVVLKGHCIEEVGTSGTVGRRAGLDVIELPGSLILPGLVDCHIHLVGYALALTGLDLSATATMEEGLSLVRDHLTRVPEGGWLTGRGWDKQMWGLSGFPTREMLDAVGPINPIALTSRDGHVLWVNSVALERLGLGAKTPHIEGGEIAVDGTGKPTGILKENAMALVGVQARQEQKDQASHAVRSASENLIRLGLTGVHTVEDEWESAVLDLAVERGDVALNLLRLREVSDIRDLEGLPPSPQPTCVKIYADGALGSQTASMLKPYCGQPGNSGITVMDKGRLREMVKRSCERGFSVAIHAIGDRANMEVLDVYEEARSQFPGSDVVLRIEHAQVLRSEDIPRFAQLNVIASMQPIHAISDMRVAQAYWGPRCRNAYAWGSILKAGGQLAFGSDAPIDDPDPLKGIHAAVTRRDPAQQGASAWYGEECLTLAEAIDCYTLGATAATGTRRLQAGIAVGAAADLTVLGHNILDPGHRDSILDARVEMTLIGGVIHANV